jgi:hypothetical protein
MDETFTYLNLQHGAVRHGDVASGNRRFWGGGCKWESASGAAGASGNRRMGRRVQVGIGNFGAAGVLCQARELLAVERKENIHNLREQSPPI